MSREKQINRIAQAVQKHNQEAEQALEQLNQFTTLLYSIIKQTVSDLAEAGVDIDELEEKNLGDGKKTLSFEWRKSKWIFIPLVGTGLPDSSVKLGANMELQAGRLIMFEQPIDEPEVGYPLYEFYVFPDGAWYAWGFGWTQRKLDGFDSTKLQDFVLYFFEALLVKDVKEMWPVRSKVDFERARRGLRSQMGFAAFDRAHPPPQPPALSDGEQGDGDEGQMEGHR